MWTIVIIIFLMLAIFAFGWLVEMGFKNQTTYVYDPLYKCWFEFGELNEEQETRLVTGSNRLADPPKGAKRQPFWKEQPTLQKKIKTFIFLGNKPRPRGW